VLALAPAQDPDPRIATRVELLVRQLADGVASRADVDDVVRHGSAGVPFVRAALERALVAESPVRLLLEAVERLGPQAVSCAEVVLRCLERDDLDDGVAAVGALAPIMPFCNDGELMRRALTRIEALERRVYAQSDPGHLLRMTYRVQRDRYFQRNMIIPDDTLDSLRSELDKHRLGRRVVAAQKLGRLDGDPAIARAELLVAALQRAERVRESSGMRDGQPMDDFEVRAAEEIVRLELQADGQELRQAGVRVLALRHEDPVVRQGAVGELDAASDAGLSTLAEAIGDADDGVAIAALERLAQVGKAARPHGWRIARELRSASPERASAAARALQTIRFGPG
jgi:hypothetical protein